MLNEFRYFELSELESKNSRATLAAWLGWLALTALVISTGVHAVSLVISQVGIDNGVMAMIRVTSPILVEVLASIVAIGFTAHAWRATQKVIGFAIEIIWLIFAAANLVTSFTIESGGALTGALSYWLHYGLPLSALIAGALFYAMLRVDPEHKRQSELQATQEAHRMAEFSARRDVLVSPQMAHVLRQRGWLAVISDLEKQGFDQAQIQFMLQGVPQLETITNGVATETAAPELPGVTTQYKARERVAAPLSLNGRH